MFEGQEVSTLPHRILQIQLLIKTVISTCILILNSTVYKWDNRGREVAHHCPMSKIKFSCEELRLRGNDYDWAMHHVLMR